MTVPPPVYPADTDVTALRTAETLLVSTLRLFALTWTIPGDSHPDWRGGLLAARLPLWATKAFDSLFSIVVVATRRPLDVRCLHCRGLGYDEGRLLQLVSLFQHGRPEAGEAVLGDWLPPTAQRLAASPAEGLAAALLQGGLVVPWRGRQPTAAIAAHQVHANPGLVLVQ